MLGHIQHDVSSSDRSRRDGRLVADWSRVKGRANRNTSVMTKRKGVNGYVMV
jgi:hypothetical protein